MKLIETAMWAVIVVTFIGVMIGFSMFINFMMIQSSTDDYTSLEIKYTAMDDKFIKEFRNTDSCEMKEYMLMKKEIGTWWDRETRDMIYDEYESLCLGMNSEK